MIFRNRKIPGSCFLCYGALMLWLLFIRYRSIEIVDYWYQVSTRINLIPFSSTGSMLTTLLKNPRPDVLWVVVYNLGGNIAMLLPLGFLLPELWVKYRRFRRCVGAVAGIMTCVEFLQLFTLRGFCEVDDVMLNVLGGAIGFGIWKLCSRKSGAQ